MRGVKGDEVLHFLHQGQDFLVPFLRKNVARCLILILKSNCCFNEHFFFFFSFCIFYICIACNVIYTHVEETIDDIDYLIRALYFICLSYLSFATYIEIFINFKSFTKEAYSLNTPKRPTDPNYFIYEQ